MFNAKPPAQMAAFFAQKEGGSINVLKLMKLLYLADRESIRMHGVPISFDYMVSMPHGPVLSNAYELTSGMVGGEEGRDWEQWIRDCEHYNVEVVRDFSRDDLDHLSDTDIEVLANIWDRFGRYGKWQLRDYTHNHCGEWEDPHGSSKPIAYETLLRELGSSPDEAEGLSRHLCQLRDLARA